MEERTLQLIEFPQALGLLAARCASAPGRAAAEALRPKTQAAAVRALCDETAEAGTLVRGGALPPLRAFDDPDPWFEEVRRRGGVLEPGHLLAIAELIDLAAALSMFIAGRDEDLPLLRARFSALPEFPELRAQIRRVLDVRGEVKDDASPELSRLRRQMRSLREEVRRLLERLMSQHPTAIQENLIVQRRDRFVIPAKTSFRRTFDGVVQDRSASGETLFVEPMGAVPLNNALTEAREGERAEVDRILRELTAAAMAVRGELAALAGQLAETDLIFAKAQLGMEWDGVFPQPGDAEKISLRQVRHPLLAAGVGNTPAGEAVPFDIALGGEIRQVVITGPNTGGKTVVLKTVGLCAALHQCGVPVPAGEESALPVFTGLFADIGDEQDLQQNLSTFSGHMARVAAGVREAGPGVLLLLDELGSGTDPAEGSALGVAILEHLAESGALAIVSTHHDALKHYAFVSPHAENASVEFDPKDLSPTYRLRMGVAGPSNALSVAERMGLPAEVLERARAHFAGDAVRPEEVMARLSEKAEKLAGREGQLSAQRAQLTVREAEIGMNEAALLRERWAGEMTRRRAAEGLMKEIRREADRLLGDMRSSRDAEGAREMARGRIRELTDKLDAVVPAPSGDEGGGEAHDFRIGEWVRVRNLNRQGQVEAVHGRGVLTVAVDGKSLRVPAAEVAPGAKPASSAAPKAAVSADVAARGNDFSLELHLRGRRADEALDLLDKYLDDAAVLGVQKVRIVHGKGSGVLKGVISDHLEKHLLVANFGPARDADGGWGVTNVELVG